MKKRRFWAAMLASMMAFEAKFPNIKVEVVEFAADEYDNVIVTQLSGKQDFDVVYTKSTPALSALIKQGNIYALDEFIKSDDSFKPEDYAGLVDQLTLDGKTYALPFRYNNNLIYYNKDLFDAAGVDYPNRTGDFYFIDPDTYGSLTEYYNEILAMQNEGLVQDFL